MPQQSHSRSPVATACVTLHGVMKVKTVNGRNGRFVVGKLSTPLGDFVVKDTLLEQFLDQDGEYAGAFDVTRIFPSAWSFGERSVVEVRAHLSGMYLDAALEQGSDPDGIEPDPIDEPKPEPVPELQPVSTPKPKPELKPEPESEPGLALKPEPVPEPLPTLKPAPAPEPMPTPEAHISPEHQRLAALFGDLWPTVEQREPVKFTDWTDRETMRRQRDALKAMGYRFMPVEQEWHVPEGEAEVA